MSHDEARRLERILKRDGRLGEFVLLALEGMTRENLLAVLDETMAALKRKNPALEALKRGMEAGDRMVSGESTIEDVAKELKEHPIRQWDPGVEPGTDPEAAARAARGFEQFMGLEAGSVAAELIGPLEGDPE